MKLPLWKRHNLYFSLSLVLVVLVSIFLRPLHSAWQPIIAGDGLGYYSYLPAKFIHNDPQLDFKWFNKVYADNYAASSFENAEDNFMVPYQGKRINKYYTGLSYIWFPFFVIGHIAAKTFDYPPDGFSPPYQMAMALASLFYLILGLLFLRGLLYQLFHFKWIATLVPLLVFFGTHLFSYAIFSNTLSHVYSFSFATGFLFYTVKFFRDPHFKTRHLLFALFFFTIGACIRPLNGLLILCVPAFVPRSFSIRTTVFEKLNVLHVLSVLLLLGAVMWQVYISCLQTGHLFSYTYTDEHFDFAHPRFIDALFSYHQGLFVYVPLLFIAFFGFLFYEKRSGIQLILLFFGIVFLYSAWWYWPILKRVMIDWYALPAIGLAALLTACKSKSIKALVLVVLVASVAYFQLKALQVQRGILDEYLTDKALYWHHFWRLTPANVFALPEQSIIKKESIVHDFEEQPAAFRVSTKCVKSGNYALLIDSANFIVNVTDVPYPSVFKNTGSKKMRLSFDMNVGAGMEEAQVLVKLMSATDQELKLYPFYLDAAHLPHDSWDHKEFGFTMPDEAEVPAASIKRILVLIWNVNARQPMYIDNLRSDFILSNTYFETIK